MIFNATYSVSINVFSDKSDTGENHVVCIPCEDGLTFTEFTDAFHANIDHVLESLGFDPITSDASILSVTDITEDLCIIPFTSDLTSEPDLEEGEGEEGDVEEGDFTDEGEGEEGDFTDEDVDGQEDEVVEESVTAVEVLPLNTASDSQASPIKIVLGNKPNPQ